ncbi:MAG TPA: hypothetical protein VKX16_14390 [Chloroflexota bacterium]|nr:hypothetical protein [Chloroflexota bacterium]
MQIDDVEALQSLRWLCDRGVVVEDLASLNPCVPGEFTLPDTYYVNSATPGEVYAGTAEGTLPLVSGRWFLIPSRIVERVPALTRNAAHVARAVRLTRESPALFDSSQHA